MASELVNGQRLVAWQSLPANVRGQFCAHAALQHCSFYFPDGLPPGKSLAVASSRMPRKLDEATGWFDALRTLAIRATENEHFFVTAAGTTTDKFTRRICQLFQIPLLVLELVEQLPSETAVCSTEYPGNSKLFRGFVGPAVWNSDLTEPTERVGRPNRDDLLINVAHTAVLLSVRSSGRVLAAAKSRLASHVEIESEIESTGRSTTLLLADKSLTTAKTNRELLDMGATAWWLYQNQSDSAKSDSRNPANSKRRTVNPWTSTAFDTLASSSEPPRFLTVDEIEPDRYLIHWTRRRVGPWPDQDEESFLDDLIFASSRREHSELHALCRILASRRILATHELTRDRRPVVCFSETPVNELISRRVFRSHLGRWDFEPYGIAIDRDLIGPQDLHPVIYGDEATWEELPEAERPFFQLHSTHDSAIDWTAEREWRRLGDLPLDQIRHDQAFVFVPTVEAANVVAPLIHWPIVVLQPETH